MSNGPREIVVQGMADAARIVATEWERSGQPILRLEGFMGAGKSALARTVAASRQGVAHVQIDDFPTVENATENTIRGRIHIEELQQAVRNALNGSDQVILDGVCLEELLPSSEFGNGFKVYVKRLSGSIPLWHDGLNVSETSANWMEEDIRRYHRADRPHERCDLVVAVPDETGLPLPRVQQ